jgi:hypothetical protein
MLKRVSREEDDITALNVVALLLAKPAKECVDRRCWSGK